MRLKATTLTIGPNGVGNGGVKTLGLFLLVIAATVAFLKMRDGTIERSDTPEAARLPARASAANAPALVAENPRPLAEFPVAIQALPPQQKMLAGEPIASADNRARKFHLTIEQIVPGGHAVAYGSFYDVAPTLTTDPERLAANEGKHPVSAGQFYVSGLPAGLVDGQRWSGWLIPSGAKTYTTVSGAYKTIPAWQVVADPPPVPYKPKPGAWMNRTGRTLLDR